MNRVQIEADELRKYAELSGDEWGEMCSYLIGLADMPDYCSDDLYDALSEEIGAELSMIKAQYRIVDRVQTIEHEYKELEAL